MDQGSTGKRSAVHNFAPTVTKFCVMWEGRALPHDTKFGNCRCEMVSRIVIFIWSLIHGSSWSGLINAEPGLDEQWFRSWLFACMMSSQCCYVINCTIVNKLWWNYDKNTYIFVHQYTIANVVWKWPFCLGLYVLTLLQIPSAQAPKIPYLGW